MAATVSSGLSFLPRAAASGKSKIAHEMAVKAYKETNGPTEDLKRIFKAYLENRAKSRKRNGAKSS